jgi:hypothetical protein
MEAARTSETLINFYQTTRRYNAKTAIFVLTAVRNSNPTDVQDLIAGPSEAEVLNNLSHGVPKDVTRPHSIDKCATTILFQTRFYTRSGVLTVVKMLMLVFWGATPCRLVGRYQRFVGKYYHHLQFSLSTRRPKPEEQHRRISICSTIEHNTTSHNSSGIFSTLFCHVIGPGWCYLFTCLLHCYLNLSINIFYCLFTTSRGYNSTVLLPCYYI